MSLKNGRLLGAQLILIGALLITGRLLAAPPWIWLELAGLVLVTWAVFTIKPQRVNPFPDVRPNAKLMTHGPYRWIRHPMYTGVLLTMLALVLDKLTVERGAIWMILLVNLLMKLNYEETLLTRRFPEYAAYRQRTRKLLPFIY